MTEPSEAQPTQRFPIEAYLTVGDAAAAIAFYERAFGAVEQFRLEAPDGRIVHCSLAVNGARLMLSDDFPDAHAGQRRSPDALGGTPVTIHLNVADIDAIFARAIAAGAKETMPPADMFWGDRYGRLEDPFGHSWSLATPRRQVSPEEMKEAFATLCAKRG
jgi:PhnB protein